MFIPDINSFFQISFFHLYNHLLIPFILYIFINIIKSTYKIIILWIFNLNFITFLRNWILYFIYKHFVNIVIFLFLKNFNNKVFMNLLVSHFRTNLQKNMSGKRDTFCYFLVPMVEWCLKFNNGLWLYKLIRRVYFCFNFEILYF